MKEFIENEAENYEIIMFDRAETILHENIGNIEYWNLRRSMRFSEKLVKLANEFRKTYFDTDDFKDNTELPAKWESHKVILI